MPSLAVLRTLARELMSREHPARVPEPDLVMDDPAKVEAYNKAGQVDGVMAPVYLFHGANACEVIQPGDLVLDLACGPANQLGMIARLNPQTRVIGVDLSEQALDLTGAVDMGHAAQPLGQPRLVGITKYRPDARRRAEPRP